MINTIHTLTHCIQSYKIETLHKYIIILIKTNQRKKGKKKEKRKKERKTERKKAQYIILPTTCRSQSNGGSPIIPM